MTARFKGSCRWGPASGDHLGTSIAKFSRVLLLMSKKTTGSCSSCPAPCGTRSGSWYQAPCVERLATASASSVTGELLHISVSTLDVNRLQQVMEDVG